VHLLVCYLNKLQNVLCNDIDGDDDDDDDDVSYEYEISSLTLREEHRLWVTLSRRAQSGR